MGLDFSDLNSCRNHVKTNVTSLLEGYYEGESVLSRAIRYSLINSGKQYRPFLLWAVGYPLGIDEELLFTVGSALEMLHVYSLVHDDLPCMDNGLERHGKPSAHVAFGEPLAVLVGDALLTDAFSILASVGLESKHMPKGCKTPTFSERKPANQAQGAAQRMLRVVAEVSQALGSRGMALGQALDLSSDPPQNLPDLTQVHGLKTAKFLELCCRVGAILGGTSKSEEQALASCGHYFGLAYQVKDDLEDKDDLAPENANICKLMSAQAAQDLIKKYADQALAYLAELKVEYVTLKHLVRNLCG